MSDISYKVVTCAGEFTRAQFVARTHDIVVDGSSSMPVLPHPFQDDLAEVCLMFDERSPLLPNRLEALGENYQMQGSMENLDLALDICESAFAFLCKAVPALFSEPRTCICITTYIKGLFCLSSDWVKYFMYPPSSDKTQLLQDIFGFIGSEFDQLSLNALQIQCAILKHAQPSLDGFNWGTVFGFLNALQCPRLSHASAVSSLISLSIEFLQLDTDIFKALFSGIANWVTTCQSDLLLRTLIQVVNKAHKESQVPVEYLGAIVDLFNKVPENSLLADNFNSILALTRDLDLAVTTQILWRIDNDHYKSLFVDGNSVIMLDYLEILTVLVYQIDCSVFVQFFFLIMHSCYLGEKSTRSAWDCWIKFCQALLVTTLVPVERMCCRSMFTKMSALLGYDDEIEGEVTDLNIDLDESVLKTCVHVIWLMMFQSQEDKRMMSEVIRLVKQSPTILTAIAVLEENVQQSPNHVQFSVNGVSISLLDITNQITEWLNRQVSEPASETIPFIVNL
jgi:hypothetical protein